MAVHSARAWPLLTGQKAGACVVFQPPELWSLYNTLSGKFTLEMKWIIEILGPWQIEGDKFAYSDKLLANSLYPVRRYIY